MIIDNTEFYIWNDNGLIKSEELVIFGNVPDLVIANNNIDKQLIINKSEF